MAEKEMLHRRFLKSSTTEYELGTFLPERVTLRQNEDPIDLTSVAKTGNGSVLFFISSSCEACNAEAVREAIQTYPEFSYIVFYEGSRNPIPSAFLESRHVAHHSFQIDLLVKNMNLNMLPYQLVLNQVGQVIAAGIINTLPMIEDLMMPLIRAAGKIKQ
ncbi:hypothetical protein ACFFSY_00470 [Paenibacillus aurantiacus]|uniref:Thioredoxin domain-containing protein n=1 Tax=Paenibacillus aurantiacus TaxID=1936118 RepID=A0ABV5KGR2_9BACL